MPLFYQRFKICKKKFPGMMAPASPYHSFTMCYKTEITSITRGHHVYMSDFKSSIGDTMMAAPDLRKEAKEHDTFAVGFYMGDLLLGHVPIEFSSLCYYFLNTSVEKQLIAIITRKRQREIGLVLPAKFIFTTKK